MRFFPGGANNEKQGKSHEASQDAEHLRLVVHRVDPEFGKQLVTGKDFDERPENDDGGDAHADVRAPAGQLELMPEHENGSDQAADGDNERNRMAVAQENRIIQEHQQQVECPHHDVQLQKGSDGSVAGHAVRHDFLTPLPEEYFLQPIVSQAAGPGVEQVQYREHHPNAESGRHDQVFGAGSGESFQLGHRHVVDIDAVNQGLMLDADAVQILGRGGDDARTHQVVMDAVSACVISKKEFNPSRPKQHAPEEAEQRLRRVAVTEEFSDWIP